MDILETYDLIDCLPDMYYSILGAAITAGGALMSTLLAHRANKKRDQRQLAANKEMSDYAYQQDVDMWNRQNQYNSPSQQMARFKEAGLNPALMYGQGQAGAGNAVQQPHYQKPEADFKYQLPDIAAAVASLKNLYQDIRVKQAQARSLDAQALSTIAGIPGVKYDSDFKDRLREYWGDDISSYETVDDKGNPVVVMSKTLGMVSSEAERTRLQNRLTRAEINRLEKTLPIELEQRLADVDLTRAQRSNLLALNDEIFQRVKNLQVDERMKVVEEMLLKNRLNWEKWGLSPHAVEQIMSSMIGIYKLL